MSRRAVRSSPLRSTSCLAHILFQWFLNKFFRQQKIREFFNSKFDSSLINWCQAEFLILKIRATVIFWKKIVISAPNNRRIIFFFKFVEKCQLSNIFHSYLIWRILTELFHFLYEKRKKKQTLKSFYNSLGNWKIVVKKLFYY